MNAKQHADPVAAAEDVLAAIQEKTGETVARRDAMIEEMGDLGFAAHGLGDVKAKARIGELSQEVARVDHELIALGAAQVEASRRLAAARRADECAVIRAKANDALDQIPLLRKAGAAAAEGLAQFIENYALLHKVSTDMRRSGVGRAWRDEVFTLACRRSLQFALYGASLNTEPLPMPSNRRELGETLERFISEFQASLQRELEAPFEKPPAHDDYGRPPPLPRIPGEEFLIDEPAAAE